MDEVRKHVGRVGKEQKPEHSEGRRYQPEPATRTPVGRSSERDRNPGQEEIPVEEAIERVMPVPGSELYEGNTEHRRDRESKH